MEEKIDIVPFNFIYFNILNIRLRVDYTEIISCLYKIISSLNNIMIRLTGLFEK